MRPRHVLILLALAALPVGLAVALTRGSGGKSATGTPATQLSLELVGGGSANAVAACGVTHHYKSFSSGSSIRFRGTISKPGKWSVKLKLKACSGGAFRSAGEAIATVHSNGSYKGSFPAPITGDYYARAELKSNGALVGRSDKTYFQVR